jgi:transcription initiation factor TFIIF subunit alpha
MPNGYPPQARNGPVPIKQEEPQPPPRQLDFSNPPRAKFQDYPLYTTKRALTEGIRYHIAKFMSKKTVDPYDQNEFPRPVTLHRRDPRAPPPGKPVQDVEAGPEEVLDSKEREKQEILKAEKERQRAEDLAQIAPSGSNAAAMAKKKHKSFRNEKTTQVHRLDKTEADKKESDLRYEEALPWFLEDVDGNNTWQGAYEAPLSGINAMLVTDGPVFRMVPIEKWYRFNQQPKFKTFTGDEVEAHMKKKFKESRWVMKTEEQKQLERDTADYKRMRGVSSNVKQESETFKAAGRNEKNDIDDLDYDDLFDNDDEQPGLEPDRDEVTVEAQARIKKEQYSSNVFGEGLFRDERDLDKEQKELDREAEMRKKFGKSTKKALRKRERNLVYQSDSEDHPYSSVVSTDLAICGRAANDIPERG